MPAHAGVTIRIHVNDTVLVIEASRCDKSRSKHRAVSTWFQHRKPPDPVASIAQFLLSRKGGSACCDAGATDDYPGWLATGVRIHDLQDSTLLCYDILGHLSCFANDLETRHRNYAAEVRCEIEGPDRPRGMLRSAR